MRTFAGLTRSPLFRTFLDVTILLLTILIGAEVALRHLFTLLSPEIQNLISPMTNQWTKDNWIFIAAAALFIAVLLRFASEVKIRAEDKRAKEGIQDHYSVMVAKLANALVAKSGPDQTDQFHTFLSELPKHLSGLAGGKRDYVEVQIYCKERHGHHSHLVPRFSNETKLSPNHYSMRPNGGSPIYADEVSKEVWENAESGTTVHHQNLRWWTWKKNLPANWKRFGNHRYGTFITVPLRGGKVGTQVVGLLTINSEIPFTLTEIDASLVELAAWMIQVGNEQCGYFDKARTYTGTMHNGSMQMNKERCKL